MPFTLTWKHNPVAWAELKHQRYVIDTNRSGRLWIFLAVLLVVPGMLVSLFYFGAALLMPYLPNLRDSFSIFDFSYGLLITLNVALYAVVTLVTLSLSARSVRREKEGQTWDNLLLTYVEPRHITLGKWWASTLMLVGDHAMIAIARLGILGWIAMTLTDRAALPPGPFDLPGEVVLLPLLAIITFIYTALDMALTSALGVIGGVLDKGGLLTTLFTVSMRIGVTVGGAALWVLTSLLLVVHPTGLWLAVTGTGFLVYVLLIWAMLAIARAAVEHHARLV